MKNGDPKLADVNTMNPIEEIRGLIRLHQDELHRRYKARVVGIFGSYVRGEQRADSDLDLLAEFDDDASLFDLGGAQIMLSEILGLKVDLIPVEDIRPELKTNIQLEAVTV